MSEMFIRSDSELPRLFAMLEQFASGGELVEIQNNTGGLWQVIFYKNGDELFRSIQSSLTGAIRDVLQQAGKTE